MKFGGFFWAVAIILMLSSIIHLPRSLYFYSIDESCSYQKEEIYSTLNEFSNNTNVKFIELPKNSGIIVGGFGYVCNESFENGGLTVGEAENGVFASTFLIFTWDKIRLGMVDERIILHETLHAMGEFHSDDPKDIMYAYLGSNYYDVEHYKEKYTSWWAKINIIPLNMFIIAFFLWIIITDIMIPYSQND